MTNSLPENHRPEPNPAMGWPGAMPTPPESANPVAAQRIPRPKVVETAFRLMLASWIVAVLLQIAAIVQESNMLPAMLAQTHQRQRAQGVPVIDVTKLMPAFIGSAIVMAIITMGLWLLFIVKMRQGRDWARVWMLVCGSIAMGAGILSGCFALWVGIAVPTWQIVLNTVAYLNYAMAIVALVLMYRPAARPYFQPPISR